MLISCLSCINRAVSRRGSDRPEGYVGKCILYERGLQGGLLALSASPTPPPSLRQQPHALWTSSGREMSFPVGFKGHCQPPKGTVNAKGVPSHITPPPLPPRPGASPERGHPQGVTGNMTSQAHLGLLGGSRLQSPAGSHHAWTERAMGKWKRQVSSCTSACSPELSFSGKPVHRKQSGKHSPRDTHKGIHTQATNFLYTPDSRNAGQVPNLKTHSLGHARRANLCQSASCKAQGPGFA